MQAIILAAGMGRRLKELTQNNTKCMVEVNGKKLVDRLLEQLDRLNLNKIVYVVGYEGQKLIDHINSLDIRTPIEYVNNEIYDKTNNIYSLYLAKEYLLEDDTLLLESDIIFEDSVLTGLLEDPRDTLALVDKYESWMDGTCVKLDENDSIIDFIPGKKLCFNETDEYYKTVNIYKFSRHFSVSHYVPFLEAYSKALGNNEYYEQVLKVITMLDDPEIKARRLSGEKWYEIDDIQDLDIAESIFAEDPEKLSRMMARYGGYWRYPKLLDFCYLVNPYYPTNRMMDEIKASFDVLTRQYPSGMYVNSLVAGRNFGVHSDNIVVGNGAAELIKSLMGMTSGKMGFIRPTFEEYPNRYSPEDQVIYTPYNPDFSYTAQDIMEFFEEKGIRTLLLINPDNPSGNYIPKNDVMSLVRWTKSQGITFILDESFADFAEEENNTLIRQSILDDNPHLYVMKSISKSYGIPGFRLGVLASGNTEMIRSIKKDVAIWNINSFGEFYMQIEEKYRKDYAKGLEKIKAERSRFVKELEQIPGLRIIPSQANYIMAEVNGISAAELTKTLLVKYDILIKDLTKKAKGSYIRLAVRDTADNDRLIAALKKEMK
ncbi:MAG: aminotransferase class I/II-fold pyridoxal phosphate-dependent enzyme [Solobacterium sp.]|nr:aminotransferase class I/II-fold pyridoxal phosphate-dependent enzyme [Solobacterium sp.]